MPITPRQPSNPALDSIILAAWAQVALGYPTLNVVLANSPPNVAGHGPIYVQAKDELLTSGIYPAGYVRGGSQTHRRISSATYDGTLPVLFDYYDAWEQRTDGLSFEQVRAQIALDLERIRSNLQENESLAIGFGDPLTVALLSCDLSTDDGILQDAAGKKLIYRRLTCHYLMLDYDA